MPRRLRVLFTLEIALGFGALLVATATIPVDPRIGIALPAPVSLPPVAVGLTFWVVLTLVGSAFAPERPQAIVVTLDLPFIVAATVLGGPVAGGWVAMIGTLELSDIPGTSGIDLGPGFARRRQVPWYGVLLNHAVPTFAAVVAGLALSALQSTLGADLAFGAAGRELVGILLVAAVFGTLADIMAFAALAQRSGRSVVEVAREFGLGDRLTLVAEAVVAWLMVEVFLPVGWWGAALCVFAIAAIYRGLDVTDAVRHGKVDALTGLWNPDEFARRIGHLLGGRRQGGRRTVLMTIALQDLELTNRRYGHHVGDEVLRAAAQRLRRSLRPADDPARLEAGMFGALLILRNGGKGAPSDAEAAEAIARRIHAEVTAPFVTAGQPVEIRATIGVAVSAPGGGRATVERLLASSAAACRVAERTCEPVGVRELPD